MIPDEIKKKVVEISEKLGINLEELKTEYKKILNEDIVKRYPEDERYKHALLILKVRHAKTSMPTQVVEGIVFDKTAVKTITTKDNREVKIATAAGIFKSEDTEVKWARLMFFNEQAELVNKLQRMKSYRLTMTVREVDGILRLGSVDDTKVEQIDDIPISSDIQSVIEKFAEFITIEEAELKTDGLKAIRGIVATSNVATSKKGNEFGIYNILDDSMDITESLFVVTCDPSQVRYDTHSDLIFVGNIQKTDEGRLGMRADAIIPIYAVEKESTTDEGEPESEQTEQTDLEKVFDEW